MSSIFFTAEPSCDLRGYTEKLHAYFTSNKRSGGGECEISIGDQARRGKINFDAPEAGERVLGKTHYLPDSGGKVKLILTHTMDDWDTHTYSAREIDTVKIEVYDIHPEEERETIAELVMEYFQEESSAEAKCLTASDTIPTKGPLFLEYNREDAENIVKETGIITVDEISFKVQAVVPKIRIIHPKNKPINPTLVKRNLKKISGVGEVELDCRHEFNSKSRVNVTASGYAVALNILNERRLTVRDTDYIIEEVNDEPVSEHDGSEISDSDDDLSRGAHSIVSSITASSTIHVIQPEDDAENDSQNASKRSSRSQPDTRPKTRTAPQSAQMQAVTSSLLDSADETEVEFKVKCSGEIKFSLLKQYMTNQLKKIIPSAAHQLANHGNQDFRLTFSSLTEGDIEELTNEEFEYKGTTITLERAEIDELNQSVAGDDNTATEFRILCSKIKKLSVLKKFMTSKIKEITGAPHTYFELEGNDIRVVFSSLPEEEADSLAEEIFEYRDGTTMRLEKVAAHEQSDQNTPNVIQTSNIGKYDLDEQHELNIMCLEGKGLIQEVSDIPVEHSYEEKDNVYIYDLAIQDEHEVDDTISCLLEDGDEKSEATFKFSKNDLTINVVSDEGRFDKTSMQSELCSSGLVKEVIFQGSVAQLRFASYLDMRACLRKIDEGVLTLNDGTVIKLDKQIEKPTSRHIDKSSHKPKPLFTKTHTPRGRSSSDMTMLRVSLPTESSIDQVKFFVNSITHIWPRRIQMSKFCRDFSVELESPYGTDDVRDWNYKLKGLVAVDMAEAEIVSVQPTCELQVISASRADHSHKGLLELYFNNITELGISSKPQVNLIGSSFVVTTRDIVDVSILVKKGHELPGLGTFKLIHYYKEIGFCDESSVHVMNDIRKQVEEASVSTEKAEEYIIVKKCADLTEKALKPHFLHKKSGGGSIKQLKKLDAHQYRIEFEQEGVAKSVYTKYKEKGCKVKKSELEIELITFEYDPVIHEQKKVCVGRIPDNVKKEHLVFYIMSLTGCFVESILFNGKGDRAELDLSDRYDCSGLNRLTTRLPISGEQMIEVRPGLKIDTLILSVTSGEPDEEFAVTARTWLETEYADDHDMSVSQMDTKYKYEISCPTPSVAEKIRKATHEQSLDDIDDGVVCFITPFSTWLGADVTSSSESYSKLRLNEFVKNDHKRSFMERHPNGQKWLKCVLDPLGVHLDKDYTIVPNIDGSKINMRDVAGILNKKTDEIISILRLNIPERVVEKLKSNVSAQLVVDCCNSKNSNCDLRLTGCQDVVQVAQKTIVNLEKAIQEEQDLKDDEVPNIQPLQINYMEKSGAFKVLQEKYSLKLVQGDPQKKTVRVTGKKSVWKRAVDEMVEIVGSLESKSSGPKDIVTIEILDDETVKKELSEEFVRMKLDVVWELSKHSAVHVTSQSGEMVDRALEVLGQAVGIETFNPDTSEIELLSGAKWHNFEKAFNKKAGRQIVREAGAKQFNVYSYSRFREDSKVEVNSFLKQHALVERVFEGDLYKVKCYTDFHREKLSKVVNECQGTYSLNASGRVLMKGSKEAVAKLQKGLETLLESVTQDETLLNTPAIWKYLGKHKEYLETIGQMTCSVLRLKETPKVASEVPKVKEPANRPLLKADIKAGLTVELIKGEITDVEANAIVHPTNGKLALHGIWRDRAGESVQKECSRIFNAGGGVIPGTCLTTTAGGLKSVSHIIHAVIPESGAEDELVTEFSSLFDGLIAEAHKKEIQTLAIPAIKCRNKVSVEKTTDMIIVALERSAESSLRKVMLVEPTNQQVLELWGMKLKHINEMRKFSPVPEILPSAERRKVMYGNSSVLKIETGEIAKTKADAIMSSVGTDLNPSSGMVSKSILNAVGSGLSDEMKKHADSHGGKAAVGSHHKTSGFNLWKEIYHCVTPTYKDQSSEQELIDMLENVLADIAKVGHCIVSMPAFGTGNLAFTGPISAKCTLKAVDNHFNTHPTSSIKGVNIVIYHNDRRLEQEYETEIATQNSSNQTQISATTSSQQSDTVQPPEHSKFGLEIDFNEEEQETADGAVGGSIDDSEDRQYYSSEDDSTMDDESGTVAAAIMISNTKLIISQGDITKGRTEALVNSAGNRIDFNGAVGKELSKLLTPESEQKILKSKMEDDGVILTRCEGDLQAKYLVHINANLPQQNEKKWLKLISLIFNKCEEKQISSISLPAIGTGNLRNSAHDMSERILKSIVQHLNKNSGSVIKEIRVVIFQHGMVKEFVQALNAAMDEGESFWKSLRRQALKLFGFEPEMPTVIKSPGKRQVKPKHSSKEMDVSLVIYSINNPTVKEQVLKKLEDLREDKTKTIMYKQDRPEDMETIRNFRDEDKQQLLRYAQKKDVVCEIHPQKGPVMHLKLHGLFDDVDEVDKVVRRLVHSLRKSDECRDKEDLLARSVNWMYKTPDDEEWSYVGNTTNMLLEDSYNRKASGKLSLTVTGYKIWTADFDTMTGLTEKGTSFEIKRHDKTVPADKLPASWAPMTGNYMEVPLPKSSDEYQKTEQYFTGSVGVPATIHQISRIQNSAQYVQFVAEQEKVMTQLKKTADQISKYPVWHGSDPSSISLICRNNFNRSYAGKNAVKYGQGSYFARDASYSDGNRYAQPNSTGHKFMIAARIVVGDYVLGNPSMKTPPYKPDGITLYNSTVNNVSNPSIFVVYSDPAAYQEYMIEYSTP